MEGWAGDGVRNERPEYDPERAPYIAASERVLEQAKSRLERYEGDCADCRWRRGLDPYFYTCANPIVKLAGVNQTDAYARERIQRCNEQRDRSSHYGTVVCGPDGSLFEPREWWRIW